MKNQQRRIKSIFLYALAIALALIVFAIISMKAYTGKIVVQERIYDSYTSEDLAEHNYAGDCWISNNENIYDITGLVDEVNFKESDCGKEIVLDDYFIDLLKNYRVGILG